MPSLFYSHFYAKVKSLKNIAVPCMYKIKIINDTVINYPNTVCMINVYCVYTVCMICEIDMTSIKNIERRIMQREMYCT